MSDSASYETILTSTATRGVGLIQLNRPTALNALNRQTEADVFAAARAFDTNPDVRAILIHGSGRAFAAGADISEMAPRTFEEMDDAALFEGWDGLAQLRTPLIAAVSGYALGGGCELAMICDLVIASESAVFGQPEVKLGILPGIGGTQRLTRAVGKAKAMDMCLTGRMIDVHEAERAGLVSRIVPDASLLEAGLSVAAEIAGMSGSAAASVKAAVNQAFETTLAAGMRHERVLFKSRFGTADQKEGMAAFLEKRPAAFAR